MGVWDAPFTFQYPGCPVFRFCITGDQAVRDSAPEGTRGWQGCLVIDTSSLVESNPNGAAGWLAGCFLFTRHVHSMFRSRCSEAPTWWFWTSLVSGGCRVMLHARVRHLLQSRKNCTLHVPQNSSSTVCRTSKAHSYRDSDHLYIPGVTQVSGCSGHP